MSIGSVLGWGRWTWTLFANASACLIVAVLCAALLGKATEGNGSVIQVTKPPAQNRFRVPLGGEIVYNLNWQVMEGGCEQIVVARFTSKDRGKENTTIEQRRKAKIRGVGQPDFDLVRRSLPPGITAGLWQYTVVIESTCATRTRTDPFVDLELDIYDTPVFRTVRSEVLSRVVPPGGPLVYMHEFERLGDLPGEVVSTFIRQDQDEPDVVVTRRPVSHTRIGHYPPTEVNVPLPEGVNRGRWRMRNTVMSRLPDGTFRVDPGADVEFEVR